MYLIQRYWESSTYDMIVMGASRVGLWGSRITGSTGSKIYKSDKTRAVVVVSAGSPIKGRFVGAVESKLDRLVPQIERENRIALVERLQSNSNLDFDFIAQTGRTSSKIKGSVTKSSTNAYQLSPTPLILLVVD